MTGNGAARADGLDQAIANAGAQHHAGANAGADPDEKVVEVRMKQVQMRLASGRPAVLAFPADLSAKEALGLISGILQIVDQVEASRKPPSKIAKVHALPRALRRG